MEKVPHTPPPKSHPAGEITPPLQNQTRSPKSLSKTGTPDRLKVPKAFKYPERYTSPTDQIISPVTRGILARSKMGRKLLPPSANQPKIEERKLKETSRFQLEKC
ncbi:hypothetical protein F511_25003 [Dorcoceras hygrometricum]|uniref:Uncharacterized protein n=1 Tax=Dorcoceras hygrometricum TaxID=472368 RepID=A0A2Z7B680_9LAMI|nr:hypothetical protein F511_04672 [Dorcoceras hygrometricum]KZV51630.1 hypothetical protein F511_25003 [Dorcoceras hygrometricum]